MAQFVSGLNRFAKASAFAGLLLALAAGIARGQQKKLPSIDDIQKAWQARQDRVRTARFIWKEKRTWPKGAISLFYTPTVVAKIPEIKGKVMPSADRTVNFSYFVTLDNDKVRYEYEGMEWSNARQDFRPTKYISAFNGKTAKDVYPTGLSDVDWPQGAIRKSAKYRDAGLSSLLPLILVYRPFVPSLKPSDDFRGMTLIERLTVLDGHPCVELIQQFGTSSVHIWVDTGRDFILVRRLAIDQGKPAEQIDLRYRHDEDIGWVPTGWKIVNHHHNGKLFYSFNAEITSAEFNTSVAPNTFDFDFPHGTWVLNEKTRESYIVRHDGSKRPVIGKEKTYSYEQLLNSDPPEAPFPQVVLKSYWPSVVALAIGLSALGVFIWRRFRLRQSLWRRNS